ncbi:hypothetical protein C5167_046943 [Papaver somniferum]|uniref:Aluminum-activated malate transporter n=1 Tax=Papaver somniferum TaxID=3469 RepID=A0A4Y7LI09_PAPSO|nr:aluminum-activated malate transporter 2-like [Papaver somniferum]RZC84158.1 hypothetical protein C5167_046943 [Papaver somniferum]
MDIESGNIDLKSNNGAVSKHGFLLCWFKALFMKLKKNVAEFANKVKEIGKDDPRRITHSIKVGITLALVSLLYYFSPVYGGFGSATMWAILTVVVVFEFSVGATLGKGLNRAIATFLAGALGVGAHHLATLAGKEGEPILLGLFVFLLAAVASFSRFFPGIKARYDYGVLIFILTFSLVSVSGYREDKIIRLALHRFSTIIIGGLSCVVISIFVFPVWAGEDLHKLIIVNIDKLGDFLQAFGGEYFENFEKDGVMAKDDKKTFLHLNGYKTILNSKTAEESFANFASWEPPHGGFGFRHPWKQYLKIGMLTRQCAYRIESLSNCINKSQVQPLEFKKIVQKGCMEMSIESGKALKELSIAVKTMRHPDSVLTHLKNSISAADNLKSSLRTAKMENTNIFELIPAAKVTTLLIEIIGCISNIVDSVNELSRLAKFKGAETTATSLDKPKQQLQHEETLTSVTVETSSHDNATHAIITVCALSTALESGILEDPLIL